MSEDIPESPDVSTMNYRRIGSLIVLIGGIFVLLLFLYSKFITLPPSSFVPTAVEIERGSSVSEIAFLMQKERVVRSATALYLVLLLQHNPATLKAGEFVFDEPQSVFDVAQRLVSTTPLETQIKITFPEGFTHFEFNNFLPSEFEEITPAALLKYEGYLFPETYFIPVSYDTLDIVELMKETAAEELLDLSEEISQSQFTEEEVVILASIIEREANDQESMKLVSGILQNRLDIGMALQVDASVAYGLGKSGTDLTRSDIEQDGPFNTYIRTGLPPTPIANPGRQALEAVLYPTSSDYFYYITGNDGEFYYAKTLDQHNKNIARHLR